MGMIALVICMVIVVNLIAGQLPENVKSIDISDNNIYGVSKTSKKVLNKLDKKVTFKIYAFDRYKDQIIHQEIYGIV